MANDAAAFDDAFALRAATLNGAKALQLDAKIGSIEAGKRADLVAVKLDEVETQPLYNVISHLAYAVSRRQISDVWIDGARKLESGALVEPTGAQTFQVRGRPAALFRFRRDVLLERPAPGVRVSAPPSRN